MESTLHALQTRTVNAVSRNYLHWTIRDLLDSFRYFFSASSETSSLPTPHTSHPKVFVILVDCKTLS